MTHRRRLTYAEPHELSFNFIFVHRSWWYAERRLTYVLVSAKFILRIINLKSNDYFTFIAKAFNEKILIYKP